MILETYQGGSSAFAPVPYMQSLRQWCTGHKALLVCDEIQAGFGRTGTLWGFEQYGIVPDLAVFGKGISGSLPMAAVAGRPEVLDQYPPLSMTSSHAGNPVCCAAALASVDLVVNERLADRARDTGAVMHRKLNAHGGEVPADRVRGRQGPGGGAGVRAARARRSPTAISRSTWSAAPCTKAC